MVEFVRCSPRSEETLSTDAELRSMAGNSSKVYRHSFAFSLPILHHHRICQRHLVHGTPALSSIRARGHSFWFVRCLVRSREYLAAKKVVEGCSAAVHRAICGDELVGAPVPGSALANPDDCCGDRAPARSSDF